jgi:competence protein ComEA
MNGLFEILRRFAPVIALIALVLAMGGTWVASGPVLASPAHGEGKAEPPPAKKPLAGKINLNTATPEQLVLLPAVGPAKAARIVTWRKQHGGFKRIADLRRVKGFGYRTFKRLEPYLEVKGETTLGQ